MFAITSFASYGMMTAQFLPTYLVSHGGSLAFAGNVLSANKFAGMFYTMLASYTMPRHGILLTLYWQLCVGALGCVLFLAAYVYHIPMMTAFAMTCTSSFMGLGLSIMCFIQINYPRSEQSVVYLRCEIGSLGGVLVAPVIMTFCTTHALQVGVPFTGLALLQCGVISYLWCQHGLGSRSKFSASLSLSTASNTDHVNVGSFSWMGIFYIVGTMFGVFSATVVSTLAAIACKRSYDWSASDMGRLTMPYQLFGIAVLVSLPHVLQHMSIKVPLKIAAVMSTAALVLLYPYTHSVSQITLVVAWILGENLAEKLMGLIPLTILSVTINPFEFPVILARAQILDSVFGSVLPSTLLYLYSTEMSAAFIAAMCIFSYLVVTVAYVIALETLSQSF